MEESGGDTGAGRQRLGEILVKRQIISEKALTHALETQKAQGGYLGDTLIKLGYLKERDVVVALVIQCSLPYIAITKYDIDKQVLQLIPENVARQYHVIPLDRVGDVLSVVMDDPLNDEIKKALEGLTACRIATFIATKTEIESAISRWYSKEPK